MKTSVRLDEIIYDPMYQPRKIINPHTVNQYADAMRVGNKFPPIILEESTTKLVSGFTRYEAYKKVLKPSARVPARFRDFKDDVERILFSIEDNTAHGQRLDVFDIKSLVIQLNDLGVPANQISKAVRLPITKIDKIAGESVIVTGTKPKFQEERADNTGQRKPLKRSLQFMKGAIVDEDTYHNMKHHYLDQHVTTMANQIIMRIQDGVINFNNEVEIEVLCRLSEALIKWRKENNK